MIGNWRKPSIAACEGRKSLSEMQVLRASDVRFLSLWKKQTSGCVQERLALYGEANLAYYREYAGGGEAQDRSFLILDGELPIVGVRMFQHQLADTSYQLSCWSLPILYLEHADSSADSRTGAHKVLKGEFKEIVGAPGAPDRVYYRDHLDRSELSCPGRVLLDLGAQPVPGFTQVIDLTCPEEELH